MGIQSSLVRKLTSGVTALVPHVATNSPAAQNRFCFCSLVVKFFQCQQVVVSAGARRPAQQFYPLLPWARLVSSSIVQSHKGAWAITKPSQPFIISSWIVWARSPAKVWASPVGMAYVALEAGHQACAPCTGDLNSTDIQGSSSLSNRTPKFHVICKSRLGCSTRIVEKWQVWQDWVDYFIRQFYSIVLERGDS